MNPFPDTPSRRQVLWLGGGAVLASRLVAGCGDGDDPGSVGAGYGAGTESSPAEGTGASPSGSEPLAQVADVPVGGAVSATDPDGKPIIVAQPTEGEIVAFSAICTHRGCTVAPGQDNIACPCHGSTFDLATGENTDGPAPDPLPQVQVEVRDGAVVAT